jgi:hypothetical protein
MKKVILSMGAISFMMVMQSCGGEKMSPEAVQAKVDSLAASQIELANANATAECETRMATELKSKTDSLVNAARMAQAAQ